MSELSSPPWRGQGWVLRRVVFFSAVIFSSALSQPVPVLATPDWWLDRCVVDTNLPPKDYAPVLRGQLCWLATQAEAELAAKLPGGGSAAISAGLDALSAGTQDRPVNLGQLKQIVLPYYQRLIAEGVVTDYPWTGYGEMQDFSPVNIGQAKKAFDFQLSGIRFNPSINGGISYSGGQTGAMQVVASPDRGLGFAACDSRPAPGSYHLLVERPQTNWSVAAWCDSDGDSQLDSWEATGEFAYNPVLVTGVVNGIDFILSDPDEDGDGIPGYEERRLGLDPNWFQDGITDVDGDGLSQADEWLAGSDPSHGDSDGDGMGDGAEVINGLSPTQGSGIVGLPFVEPFELPGVACGELAGQNGWSCGSSNIARVVTNPVAVSLQVLKLKADTNQNAVVEHPLAAYGSSVVWIDFRAIPVRRLSAASVPFPDDLAAAFYVDRTGYLTVYDATFSPGSWVSLTHVPALEDGQMNRFTVYLDYAGQRWGLWLNGSNVVRSLPFVRRSAELARLRFRSAFYQDALLDDMSVSTNAPAGFEVDSDLDGMPDEWERRYGFDPYNPAAHSNSSDLSDPSDPSDSSDPSDPDFDGLTSLQEFQQGLDPLNPDCDSDGLSDGVEWALQTSPTNVQGGVTAAIPFVEPFESPLVGVGDLQGQHGWAATVTNWACVMTNRWHGGQQALCLTATTNGPARTYQAVRGELGATTWTDLYAQPVRRLTFERPGVQAASTAAFYIDEAGYPVVANGSNWVVLNMVSPLLSNNWSRFTVMQDYSNQVWSLYLEGRPIAENLEFMHRITSYSGMRCSGSRYAAAWLDDIQVTREAPGDIDTDGDGMPNDWERGFGLDPLEPSDWVDSDDDGLPDLQEYLGGLDPLNPDCDGDGLGDGAEQARGLSATNSASYLALPFSETFEAPTVTNGVLAGQHGWRALAGGTGAVIEGVQPYSGLQGLTLQSGGATSPVVVYQPLRTAGASVIWTDLRAVPVFRTDITPPTLEPATTVGFYVEQGGRVVVSDATNWVTLTNGPVLMTNTWVRFTTCQDYSNRCWSLYLDGWPVAAGLRFATAVPREYSGVVVKHAAQRPAHLDEILVSSDRSDLSERFPYSDWSNLDDTSDPDHDGLANQAEFRLGLDPRAPDSDGDGMGDGAEHQLGLNPAISNMFNGLPLYEPFEAPWVTNGFLQGQHGWLGGGATGIVVQTNVVFEGEQAVALAGTGSLSRVIAAAGKAVVWSDFQARPVRRFYDGRPEVGSNAATAFFVNSTGSIEVCEASGWTVLAGCPVVSTSQWTRFTVKADYGTQRWALWIDGVGVGDGLVFARPVREFSVLGVSASHIWPGYFDGLTITTNEPAGLDDDGDGLPNAWEILFGFDPSDRTDPSDFDLDGLTNLEEWQAGTDPRDPDSDGDGLVDGADGEVPLGLFPQGVDRDGDGFADGEADYGCDPLNPDTDGDGMADGAEAGQTMSPALDSLRQGLVAWYRLDETNGTVLADSSSYQRAGVWVGDGVVTSAMGRVGRAVEFDGLTNGILIPSSDLLTLTSNLTLSVWISPGTGNTTGTQMVVERQGGFALQLRDRLPEVRFPGFAPEWIVAPLRLAAGEWSQLTIGYSGSNAALYVDGSVLWATNLVGSATGGGSPVTLGGGFGGTNRFFAGRLDEVRVYGRLLGAAEIGELYAMGADPDGDTVGTQDELKLGSDPAQGLLAAGIAGDLDGDGRLTARDRTRLQGLVADLGQDCTQFEYDEDGNLIRKTDALGNVTRVTYNGNNRPVILTDANGAASYHEVDAVGAVTAVTDPMGAVTRFGFNAFGNVTNVVDPGGNQTRIAYNAAGQAVRTVNARGVAAVTIYDDLGRVQEVIAAEGCPEEQRTWSFYDVQDHLVSNRNAVGVVNKYDYDVRGLLVKQVSAWGTAEAATEETGYDARGLAVSWKTPRGFSLSKTYDALGRVVTSTDALGNMTRWSFDNNGNPIATIQPNGRIMRQDYDKWGRVVRQVDGADQVSTEYDVLNRVIARSDWRGIRSEFGYDAIGNVVQAVEAKGTVAEAVTRTVYDRANRPVRVTNANGGQVGYAYDVCGNKVAMSNELGRVTRWGYQYGNRLAWLSKPDGILVSNRYDALDRVTVEYVAGVASKALQYDILSRITNAVDFNEPGTSVDDNRVDYVYDGLNRVVREWQNGRLIERHFDVAGNADQLVGPSGLMVRRVFNGNNRLAELKNSAGTVTFASYVYTPNGRVQTVTYASGVVETHGYDGRERLSSLRQQGVNCDFNAVLARDPNGNVTLSSESSGEGASYSYDAANRVTAKKALNDVLRESLEYDPLGNWLSTSNPVEGQVSRSVNAGNQYTRVGAETLLYDLNGSLTTRGQAGYRYDERGRLMEVRSNGVALASYTYDAFNRRVSKQVGGTHVAYYYDGEALIDESVNGAWGRSYVFADTIDTPVVLLRSGIPYYYLRDWRANVAFITDSSGRPVEQYQYSLFGQMQVLDGNGAPLGQSSLGNIWTFAARQWDQESGLLHYRNRAYAPELGRFLQQDPAGYADGLNLYAYAGNNPLMFSDPYGLYRWSHGALDSRIGEWITAQYGELREIERQRREYEEALRQAEEERRRQQQAANDRASRAARAVSQYQKDHPGEIKDMVRRYRHLGVDEREATQLLMSGITNIPRLGASVGPNDTRREWWLDYYLRGGQVNDVMQGEMNRMGIGNVDQFFAKTSEKETKLREKRKAVKLQYTMAAVAIVATIVTCGAGGVLGAALLGTVGVTATTASLGAFVVGAVVIQGVASAATTMLSRGNLSDFAQSWAINSAASVAGYSAGFSVAKAGGELSMQMATQSAASTFVASGSRAAMDGGGFKNVFRDTAISFAAGGMMGAYMSAQVNTAPPANFDAYLRAASASRLGVLTSPISGGLHSSLRAAVSGGDIVSAFGDGAVSKEALVSFAMTSVIAPVATWISSAMVDALPADPRPVAKPVVWVERPPVRAFEGPLPRGDSLGLRAFRGSAVTVASHVQKLVAAPARSLLAIYKTITADTWKKRALVINPFSRSFAGFQLVDGAADAALVAGGLPISFLSGDFLESKWSDGGAVQEGVRVVNFNGMANSDAEAEMAKQTISGVMGAGSVTQVSNGTHGKMILGDIVQAIGNEFGLIDITAIRGADRLRAAAAIGGGAQIDVTAHSQGSMTFRRALDLVDDPGIRGRIRYQGIGSETFISKEYLGLKSADNYWNRSTGGGAATGIDFIPSVNFIPTPDKVFGDYAAQSGGGSLHVVQSPYNVNEPNGNHHGIQYYAGYLQK